jgi:protein-disulfide isomerase
MKDKILIVLGILQTLVLITILIVLISYGNAIRPKQVKAHMEPHTIEQEPIKLNEKDPIWGSNDAEYTLVAYIDYECPFCKDMYKNIKELEEEYIRTGKVKIVFRDLPLRMHEHARTIAHAAECARQAGKYWEFADMALANTEPYSEELLKSWAENLDLELEMCIEDVTIKDVILEDLRNARTRRLRGTPAIFINDEYYRGTIPASDLRLIFEGKKPVKRRSGVCNQP